MYASRALRRRLQVAAAPRTSLVEIRRLGM
jgi:hypothetical protein